MVYLPGDLKKEDFIEQLIRVNHAGELGAKRIYEGQLFVFKNRSEQKLIREMLEQELEHLDFFEKEMIKNKVRPSVLTPVWNILGFALGVGTAALGKNAAMLCTEAVEEVIDDHYKEQLKQEDLPKYYTEKIEKFRQDELEHHALAKNNREELGLAHKFLYKSIKIGCKCAIAIAKKF